MQPHLHPPTKSPRGGWGGEGPKYQHPVSQVWEPVQKIDCNVRQKWRWWERTQGSHRRSGEEMSLWLQPQRPFPRGQHWARGRVGRVLRRLALPVVTAVHLEVVRGSGMWPLLAE